MRVNSQREKNLSFGVRETHLTLIVILRAQECTQKTSLNQGVLLNVSIIVKHRLHNAISFSHQNTNPWFVSRASHEQPAPKARVTDIPGKVILDREEVDPPKAEIFVMNQVTDIRSCFDETYWLPACQLASNVKGEPAFFYQLLWKLIFCVIKNVDAHLACSKKSVVPCSCVLFAKRPSQLSISLSIRASNNLRLR